MFVRTVTLFLVFSGVLMAQTVSKKKDHVFGAEPLQSKEGDRVYVSSNDLVDRISEPFLTKVLEQKHTQHQKAFSGLKAKYLGWSYIIKSIETTGPNTIATVKVMPRIEVGGASAIAAGLLEEVYRVENGELHVVSSKVQGSLTSWISD